MMTPTVIGMRMPKQSLEARLCISSDFTEGLHHDLTTDLTHLTPEAMW